MIVNLSFLPRQGVCGTLYLYLTSQAPLVEREEWLIMSWDGKQFHTHSSQDSLEKLRSFADTLLWAGGWPRIECCATERKINPCIKVEFEYQDGRVQRLTGSAAERWLKDVNGVLATQAIHYGQSQTHDRPWTFSRKDDDA